MRAPLFAQSLALLTPAPFFVAASAARAAAQSIANNAATAVAFDTEVYDYGAMFDTGAATRLTAPVTGFYQIDGYIKLANNANSTRFGVQLSYSGLPLLVNEYTSNGVITPGASISAQSKLTAGDYLELLAFQVNSAAAAVNLTLASLTIHRFG